MDTKSILAELEDLGATGAKVPVVPVAKVVKEARAQSVPEIRLAPPSPDDRGEKMARLADIVIGELDNLVVAASSMRDALMAMKDLWVPADSEGVTEAPSAPMDYRYELDDPLDLQEDSEFYEDEVPEVESTPESSVARNPQGSPNAMGDIAVTIPAPVPLPADLADLPE